MEDDDKDSSWTYLKADSAGSEGLPQSDSDDDKVKCKQQSSPVKSSSRMNSGNNAVCRRLGAMPACTKT